MKERESDTQRTLRTSSHRYRKGNVDGKGDSVEQFEADVIFDDSRPAACRTEDKSLIVSARRLEKVKCGGNSDETVSKSQREHIPLLAKRSHGRHPILHTPKCLK